MKRPYSFLPNSYVTTFTNQEGSEFKLRFRLYDHPATRHWLELIKKTLQLSSKVEEGGVFFGRAFNDVQKMMALIDGNVKFHNKYVEEHGLSAEMKIPFTVDNPPTQVRLNLLHEYFEKLVDLKIIQSDNLPARNNLMELNINIHKTESSLFDNDECHIELISTNFMKYPMPENAYPNFSPDYVWGEMVLAYGITGVPTVNAFRSNSEPTPQNFLNNGMMMTFWGDIKFDQWDELRTWLRGKGLDPDDPKCALGYIPLGIIDGVEEIDRKALLNKIRDHAHVSKYELVDETLTHAELTAVRAKAHENDGKEAQWPYDPEIHYHLDLVPYIDLKVEFDAKALFDEAYRARDYFVVHREYDQRSGDNVGKWKSLGLRSLFGDYTKTSYHTEYQFEGKAIYNSTVFAQLCPETMRFLSSITDLEKCERVRFMLLEPGASIKVHRDSTRDTSLAVNISLNMPEGCEMHAQLNADGTSNPYTVKLPFKDSGSVLLFNNAKYHKVVNNSSAPRIHIIFHGPIKFTDRELLDLAKQQNKITDRLELLKKLIQKKGHLGESLENSKNLMADWVASGLRSDSLPPNIVIAVYDHLNYFPGHTSAHHLEKRTLPTLFPLAVPVIKEEEWDNFILASSQLDKDVVVLMAAGTFVGDLNKFIAHLVTDCNELLTSGNVASGHLMDFNNGQHLPYFHEQFVIINLKQWQKVGRPKLGSIFSPEKAEYRASISKVKKHDDYTPEFIRASKDGEETELRTGEFGWGSGVILKAVENGLGVGNLSDALRMTKFYSYPRDELATPKQEIEQKVSAKLNFSLNEVFYFNNEPLHAIDLPDFHPEKFVSVAAGMKPFSLLRQFKVRPGCEIHFRDFSTPALKYIKALTAAETISDLEKTIVEKMKSDPLKKYSPDTAIPLLNNVIREYFDGSAEALLEALRISRNASFEEANLVADPQSMIQLFRPKEKFFAWISNAFYNNQLYLLMTKVEAEIALLKLVNGIAAQTDLRAFRYRDTHTFVFGKGLDFVKGVLTDGSIRDVDFEKGSWNETTAG